LWFVLGWGLDFQNGQGKRVFRQRWNIQRAMKKPGTQARLFRVARRQYIRGRLAMDDSVRASG